MNIDPDLVDNDLSSAVGTEALLACPATSCECERAFSNAKKLITPERNSLGDNIIEALGAWWDNGFIKRL